MNARTGSSQANVRAVVFAAALLTTVGMFQFVASLAALSGSDIEAIVVAHAAAAGQLR